ncbi:MAG: RDD family protein, partial [Hyphomicrobiaceae bacterium]
PQHYQPQSQPYQQQAYNPYPASNPYQQAAVEPGLYADFGQRFISGLIDNLIYIGIYLVGFVIVSLFFIPGVTALSIIGGILAIPVYIAPLAYLVYFMSVKGGGQTIGDRVAGYRTIHEPTGQPMPLGKTFLWVLILAFVGFISWIWILIDPKKRALHNIVSESVAIRTK